MNADCRNASRENAARRPVSGGARGNSQQRVGILRNPNRAPLPPPRRATLMGKWPRLRSSRRAGPGTILSAAQALGVDSGAANGASSIDPAFSTPAAEQQPRPATGVIGSGADAGHGANQGTSAPGGQRPLQTNAPATPKIDIARLMEEVADLGEKKRNRSRFGAGICAANRRHRAVGSDAKTDAAADPANDGHATAFATLAPGDVHAHGATWPSNDPPPPVSGQHRRASAWVLAGLTLLATGLWLGS